MFDKFEGALFAKLRNVLRVMGSLTFESGVVQNDVIEMMAETLINRLKDGEILRQRLLAHKNRLEIVLSYFNEIIERQGELDND